MVETCGKISKVAIGRKLHDTTFAVKELRPPYNRRMWFVNPEVLASLNLSDLPLPEPPVAATVPSPTPAGSASKSAVRASSPLNFQVSPELAAAASAVAKAAAMSINAGLAPNASAKGSGPNGAVGGVNAVAKLEAANKSKRRIQPVRIDECLQAKKPKDEAEAGAGAGAGDGAGAGAPSLASAEGTSTVSERPAAIHLDQMADNDLPPPLVAAVPMTSMTCAPGGIRGRRVKTKRVQGKKRRSS